MMIHRYSAEVVNVRETHMRENTSPSVTDRMGLSDSYVE